MRFEGIVNCVNDRYVDCSLYDLEDQTKPLEFAAIAISKFEETPFEGMAFHWDITNGESKITIQKPRVLTKEQKEEIKNKAREILGANQ